MAGPGCPRSEWQWWLRRGPGHVHRGWGRDTHLSSPPAEGGPRVFPRVPGPHTARPVTALASSHRRPGPPNSYPGGRNAPQLHAPVKPLAPAVSRTAQGRSCRARGPSALWAREAPAAVGSAQGGARPRAAHRLSGPCHSPPTCVPIFRKHVCAANRIWPFSAQGC